MTTKVVIEYPIPNHLGVKVTVQDKVVTDAGGEGPDAYVTYDWITSRISIMPLETIKIEEYVHNTRRLIIEEIDVTPAKDILLNPPTKAVS